MQVLEEGRCARGSLCEELVEEQEQTCWYEALMAFLAPSLKGRGIQM